MILIEIVFSESAYGSLKVGQSYGVGKYRGGSTSVFIKKDDGSQPSKEERHKAQRQAEEKARRDWESAIPLGSKANDIYCFDLAWSIGEITESEIGSQRREVLHKLRSIWPQHALDDELEINRLKDQTNFDAVLERCATGEPIRVWYSHNPDEMCGMYWLLSQLRPIKSRGPVFLVKLPEWEYREDGVICSHNGWGEIGPGEWGLYQTLQQEAMPAFFSLCAAKWSQLREENAPLRVFLNGQLQSASDTIYDSFILREIEKQPEVFVEAIVVGNVLGKYQLGIGDAWVALRIEKMIEAGKLEVVEPAAEGDIIYRQKLRKL